MSATAWSSERREAAAHGHAARSNLGAAGEDPGTESEQECLKPGWLKEMSSKYSQLVLISSCEDDRAALRRTKHRIIAHRERR